MVAKNTVNLALVSEEYGLFINPESKTINIRLPNQSVDFTYSRITPVGGDAYMFVDSPFSFTLKPNLVQARYSLRGANQSAEFRVLQQPIRAIISEEESRRGARYREFTAMGPTFRSDWGTLTFTGDGRFIFNDTQSLQDFQIILPSDGNSGRVLFDLYLDDALCNRFDGAFALVFDESAKRIIIAYRMGVGGFEASWVEQMTPNHVLLSQYVSPIETIFVK